MCPAYDVLPSIGSREGQEYTSASGDTIPNLGEQVLNIVTTNGREGRVKYQVANVSRPLNSVSEICDAGDPYYGQEVTFGRKGGKVVNLKIGEETLFPRVRGIYEFQFWVKPPDCQSQGFPRQER